MALVVVTGGARSGKSTVAERLASERGGRVAVAVFGEAAEDAEMAERISRHRQRRPTAWRTVEPKSARGWIADVSDDELLVLDCLGTLLGRLMAEWWDEAATGTPFREAAELPVGYAEDVEHGLAGVVDDLAGRSGDTLVVTNEVGDGVVPAYASGRLFRDALGRANRALVARADAAWLVIAGRCVELSGPPASGSWPHD